MGWVHVSCPCPGGICITSLIVVKTAAGRKLCSPLSPQQVCPQPTQRTVTAGTEDSMMGDHREPGSIAQISRLCLALSALE